MNLRDFSLFDHFEDGVQVLCSEFRYRYLNDAVVAQSGKNREEPLGKTMMEAYPGIEDTWIFRAIREALLSQRAVRTTNDFTFPDGSVRYFQLKIQPDSEGVVIFSSDITDEQAHLVLLVLMESWAYNAKDVEQSAQAVAFALQAPLRSVEANIAFASDEGRRVLAPEVLTCLENAACGVERMRTLVKVILEHAQLGTKSTPEEVATLALVDEVCSGFRGTLQRIGGEVLFRDLPTVCARIPELRPMFEQLIDNAIKFRTPDTPLRIHVSALRRGRFWEFAVADNGIGIDCAYHADVFRIFRRLHTEREYEGVGAGLGLCETVARLHGGKIWVDSALGEGSVFRFTLSNTQAEPTPVRA